jgi:hypothetical protein
MRPFYKTSKIILITFFALELFVFNIFPVLAFPSASSIAAELERRYHLNLQSIQNQGEFFNVADQKKIAPEVSLFFSPSDPKEGEKITAKAFPVYFSNPEGFLYYTWYLKHKGCELGSRKNLDLCDSNNDGKITIEDWKVEAMRIIAQNGYEGQESDAPLDDDGYKAKFGGENKSNVPDHCYVHDAESGINYELTENSSETTFSCPAGTSPVCMVVEADDSSLCSVSGLPACSSGTPFCNVGSPRCVDDLETATACSSFSALSTCSTTSSSGANPICEHLFPNATGETSGDGKFNEKEENFWGTDPRDADTADNGNKDEANVVGLGRQTFIWNYAAGDMVGVVVEGTSMMQTKHDDSSFMIMWAFSKNDCPVPGDVKGSYTKRIKGYNVVIPTAAFDLNDCIERNLVDPTEGGQATNLEVAVTAIPDNPVNDESPDKSGDMVIAQASISNAKREITDTLFEWKVSISDKISNISSDFTDITEDLRKAGLLGNTKGNALDNIAVKMDISENIFEDSAKKNLWNSYTADGIAYLRFKVDVTENFSSGLIRHGNSDVIVKFTSSEKKISAYLAEADLPVSPETRMKVSLPEDLINLKICDEDALDRSVCRIIKNEVIGLKVDNTDKALSNFHWTINGAPLLCSHKYVSDDCSNPKSANNPEDTEQNNVNFFPVTGDIGDTYTVTLTANNEITGKILTLTRAFNIVDPLVNIKSIDESVAWPKLLGQYKDITGKATQCPGGLCNDYSTIIFQTSSGSSVGLKAAFIPSFLRDISKREWRVDGEIVEEINPGEINFTADKLAGEIYNVDLATQVTLDEEIRRALLDIWNISPFDSTEINFAASIQMELKEQSIVQGPFQSERKYLAALVSYVPASLLFTFRIILSGTLLLFAASFLNAILQDRREKIFVDQKF